MKNRIGLLLKVKDVTASKFAEMIGVQPSNISHILSGRNKPSLDFITKVIETFPDINLEWLMFGKGSMFHHEQENRFSIPIEEQNEVIQKMNERQTEGHIPDLFSQDYVNEIVKVDDFSRNKSDIKISEHENIPSVNIQPEEQKDDPEIQMKESEIDSGIKDISDTNKQIYSEIPAIKPMKPEKIIFIYPDETFEIFSPGKRNN